MFNLKIIWQVSKFVTTTTLAQPMVSTAQGGKKFLVPGH